MASRRHVLKGIAAGIAAAAAGAVGRDEVLAGNRGPGQICRKTGDCLAGLTCDPAEFGRKRCSCAEGTACGGVCCNTYCDPEAGCTDEFVDAECYTDCVNEICFGVNSTSYRVNGSYSCAAICAYQYCQLA